MITFGIMMLFFALSLIIGIPIAVSIGVATYAGLLYNDVPLSFVAQLAFSGLDNYTYLAIPMFILAGFLMEVGGLSKRIVNFAASIVGNISGGLAIITVVACVFFAAISGSSPATVAAIGSMMIPSMIKKGYDKDFSGAVTASAGSLGILVPPSIPMIIYAVTAEVSVGEMFLAGIFPGLIMGLGLIICVFIISKKRGFKNSDNPFVFKNVLKSLWEAKWSLFTPVLILGGIYSGIFTATEASVVTVIYALFVGFFINKELKLKKMPGILKNAAITTGTVIIILGFATAFARFLTLNQVPQMLGNAILSFTENKMTILLLFVLLIFITGMFLETSAQILIYTPLFLPMLMELGVSPIHFGIILIVGTELGLITPPVGVNLFVAQGITGSSMGKISKNVVPFILSMLIIQLLLTFVPQLVTFLPDFLYSFK